MFVGGWAIAQLWLFWVAPIVGGVLGAGVYRLIGGAKADRRGVRRDAPGAGALTKPAVDSFAERGGSA